MHPMLPPYQLNPTPSPLLQSLPTNLRDKQLPLLHSKDSDNPFSESTPLSSAFLRKSIWSLSCCFSCKHAFPRFVSEIDSRISSSQLEAIGESTGRLSKYALNLLGEVLLCSEDKNNHSSNSFESEFFLFWVFSSFFFVFFYNAGSFASSSNCSL